MNLTEVSMAFPYYSSISKTDPQRAVTANQSNIIRNLYGRLVTLDNFGGIQPDLAESFYWNGDTCILKMRPGLKTISGHPITAEDAYLSLLRIILREQNTHGNLKEFLCPNLQDIQDPCKGLAFNSLKNEIKLTVINSHFRPFLIPLLAGIDFSIIPKTALEKDITLPVKNYTETSGPYYLKHDDINGNLVIKANTFHYLISDKSLINIRFIPAFGIKAIELFNEGKVDIISSLGRLHQSDLNQLNSQANVFKTKNILLTKITFTAGGRKKISSNHRVQIGYDIRKTLINIFSSDNGSPATQFFPHFSEGRLTPQQESDLSARVSTLNEKSNLESKITLAVIPPMFEKYKKIFSHFTEVNIVSSKAPPWTLPEDQQPDAYLSATDSTFLENISLLYYNFSIGTFGPATYGDQWIRSYMSLPNKEDRIRMLRRLMFDLLYDGDIIPIYETPYISIARKPLHIDFPEFYAGTPLWKITNK